VAYYQKHKLEVFLSAQTGGDPLGFDLSTQAPGGFLSAQVGGLPSEHFGGPAALALATNKQMIAKEDFLIIM